MSTKLPAVILADFTTSLATAVAVGATTATIQSNVDDDGVTLPDGLGYFTIDGSNSSKEHIQFVKTGANLASIQSVSRQGTLTSGFARAHRLGATVTLTDFATIKYLNDLLKGSTNLDSANPLKYDGTADMTGDTNKIATVKYVNDTAIAGGVDASSTVKGIAKLSVDPVSATEPIAVGDNDTRVPTQSENDALAGTSGTPSSTNKYVTNDDTSATSSASKVVRMNASGKLALSIYSSFGGTGADGALNLTSGTTNIDLGGVKYFTKNYTSISVTGTANVTFSNPHINGTIVTLKSQGNVTVTTSATRAFDMRSIGGAQLTSSGDGNIGTSCFPPSYPGPLASSTIIPFGTRIKEEGLYLGITPLYCGSSGGKAESGGGNSGAGAGALYIECGGDWNVTSNIDLSGQSGSNGGSTVNHSTTGSCGGPSYGDATGGAITGTISFIVGGGGGGGGVFLGLYAGSLIANSGTYTVTAGGGSVYCGSGGVGYSYVGPISNFV